MRLLLCFIFTFFAIACSKSSNSPDGVVCGTQNFAGGASGCTPPPSKPLPEKEKAETLALIYNINEVFSAVNEESTNAMEIMATPGEIVRERCLFVETQTEEGEYFVVTRKSGNQYSFTCPLNYSHTNRFKFSQVGEGWTAQGETFSSLDIHDDSLARMTEFSSMSMNGPVQLGLSFSGNKQTINGRVEQRGQFFHVDYGTINVGIFGDMSQVLATTDGETKVEKMEGSAIQVAEMPFGLIVFTVEYKLTDNKYSLKCTLNTEDVSDADICKMSSVSLQLLRQSALLMNGPAKNL